MRTHNILYVIVLYHCSLKDSKTFLTLKPSINNVIIFDNSEQAQNINEYVDGAVYIHNKENLGLSKCYNKAALYAKENGYTWILLLDQDTDFSKINISDYIEAIQNSGCQLVAPLVKFGSYTMSPMDFKHHYARLSKKHYAGVYPLKDISIINSGMCINVDAFIKCGGYNEKVFLDYSDHEFIRRFKQQYYEVFIIPKQIFQDFSVKNDNIGTAIKRFTLFCKSIRGCERKNWSDNFWLMFVIVKRACSLTLSTHSFIPFRIIINEYFKY